MRKISLQSIVMFFQLSDNVYEFTVLYT